jgi:hypothetical protein
LLQLLFELCVVMYVDYIFLRLQQATCLPRPAPRLALEETSLVAESPRAESPQVSAAPESSRSEVLQVWFGLVWFSSSLYLADDRVSCFG